MTAKAQGNLVLATRPDEQSNRSRVEVMPTAEKARNGPFYFTITRDDLESYATYINEHGMSQDGSGGRIPVDYEHTEHGRGSVAAGWFLAGTAEVVDTDDGARLYADVQWSSTGAEEIRDGRYRFLSPEFSFAEKDTKTGLMTKAKEFIAATLTNRPFFEMAPVTAALWNATDGLEHLRQLVHAALNPATAAGDISYRYWVMDVAQGKALVQESATSKTFVVPFSLANDQVTLSAQSDWVEAEQEWVAAVAESLKQTGPRPKSTSNEGEIMDLKALAAELDLDEDASEEEILEAVKTTKAKAAQTPEPAEPKEGEVVVSSAELTKLRAQAARGDEAGTKLRTMEIDTMLTDAVREFRILPAQKEAFKAQAEESDSGFQAVKAAIEATPKDTLKVAVRGSSEQPEDSDEPDSDAKVARAAKAYETKNTDGVDEESVALTLRTNAILEEAGVDPAKATQAQCLEAAKKARAQSEAA
jgi:phage I-like protein